MLKVGAAYKASGDGMNTEGVRVDETEGEKVDSPYRVLGDGEKKGETEGETEEVVEGTPCMESGDGIKTEAVGEREDVTVDPYRVSGDGKAEGEVEDEIVGPD